MGKASSSKKVARAARAGGVSSSNRRRLGFPALVVVICLLGVGMVVYAQRNVFGVAASEPPIANQDHWHAAYGFYVCGSFRPPLQDIRQDATGLHTHGDGAIHIHPFLGSAAGRNATLGKWGETLGLDFGDTSITLPDGTVYEDGYDCGGMPATVSIYQWANADPSTEPTIYTSGFNNIVLNQNGALFTFAVVPEGTEVPRPESAAVLESLDPTGSAPVTSDSPDGQEPVDQLDQQIQDQIDQQIQDQIDQQMQGQVDPDQPVQDQVDPQANEPPDPAP